MNHIHQLTKERNEARQTVAETRQQLTDLIVYLTSDKFGGPDTDYVRNVRTDILPKLSAIQFSLYGHVQSYDY